MKGQSKEDGFSRRLFYWWADHPWIQVCVLLLMTTLTVMGFWNPRLLSEPIKKMVAPLWSLVEDSEEQQSDRRPFGRRPSEPEPDVTPFQISGGDCVLVVKVGGQDDVFASQNLPAVRRVAEDLEALPQISRVMWLEDVPPLNLFGLVGTLLPQNNASDRRLAATREAVLANPLAVGQFISEDGRTLVINLGVNWFYATDDEKVTTAIRERAEQTATELNATDLSFQLTGRVPLDLMMAKNHVTDSFKYQMIGYSIMLISALVLFRGISAVIIVALAPAVGVFWTTGMLHFFDLQDNPFNDIIVPVLISLVGLTDSVHLMVEIRQQRASGLSVRDATRQAIARVGMACFLTSLTTGIGFFSLLVSAHHEVVREFGCCCVIGVMMTFVSVLTVIPLGCRSPLGRRLHVGLGKSLIDGQLRRIGPLVSWVLRHDRRVAMLAIVSTVVLALVSLQLQPDEKRYSGLSESGEAAQALRHLDDSFGGLDFASVEVSWVQGASETEMLEVMQQVGALLGDHPLFKNPIGIHTLVAQLPGHEDLESRILMFDLLPPPLKRALYRPERRNASVKFRVQDLGIAAYSDSFTAVDEGLVDLMEAHPDFFMELGGNAAWRWRNVYQIVTDLAKSLGAASILIWIILTVVYRSIRIGLISIVPNLFPLVATAAMLVFAGQYLEMVTVCVFTICVGIAVDDTIHFLTRYKEESELGGSHQEVIRRAFTGVGSALLMTTIVLVAGMGSAILGDSRDARLFGIMGGITLVAALFADIVLLPALLSRFAKPPQTVSDDDVEQEADGLRQEIG